MESEEPPSCLVNTLCYEVSGECFVLVYEVSVLKRIMYLCVRHCARIKPHVDEVKFPCQYVARLTDKADVIHIRTVQIDAAVVLL